MALQLGPSSFLYRFEEGLLYIHVRFANKLIELSWRIATLSERAKSEPAAILANKRALAELRLQQKRDAEERKREKLAKQLEDVWRRWTRWASGLLQRGPQDVKLRPWLRQSEKRWLTWIRESRAKMCVESWNQRSRGQLRRFGGTRSLGKA